MWSQMVKEQMSKWAELSFQILRIIKAVTTKTKDWPIEIGH